MNIDGTAQHIRAEAVPLREKLRAIRDSDHPARHWARNVVQIMDELKEYPTDPDTLRALGQNVVMFERAMWEGVRETLPSQWLSYDEIASIFGLGGHHDGNQ